MIKINSLLQRGLKKLWTSKSGGVLVYLAFGLPMLLGAMALSVDLGRAFILNTELKDFSDAAALAGAAELDGRVGSMAAAEAAARTGISGTLLNIQAFATDGSGPGLVVDQVVFLQSLPADGTNFTAGDTADADVNARFIFVSVVNRNVRSGLSRALGVIPDFDTSARSIAGFSTVVCRLPAMFMCNPLEDPNFPTEGTIGCIPATDLGIGVPLKEECLSGRGMLAKNGGGGGGGGTQAQYFPGEFGLLSCPEGIIPNDNGIRCVAESIAQSSPNNCIASMAFPQTGQGAGPIRQAINVRFDVYENPFYGGAGIKNNPVYRAPLNVTKGYRPTVGKSCATAVDLNDPIELAQFPVAPLPRDDCFYNVPRDCVGGDRYGPGNWQANGRGDDYWTKSHDPNTDGSPAKPADYANMSRYEVYRYEIETMNFNANATGPATGEPGVPRPDSGGATASIEEGRSCNYNPPVGNSTDPDQPNYSDPILDANTTGADEIDRRVLVLAAVNCIEHGPFQGAQPDGVPVEGYLEVFLTEPTVQAGPEQLQVWTEIKGVLATGSDGLRDIVQLYR